MNQKQCKRMFEQMQPPEAVVQRLQQKIRAEEEAVPPSQRSARQTQIVRFTKASSKPPRPSWRSIASGVTAAVLLLGIGTGIGYRLQKTEPFVPSSESTPDTWSMQQTTAQKETSSATITSLSAIWANQSDAEKYDSLLYNNIIWRKASALTDESTQLGSILGEGSLTGSAFLNGNTTISEETKPITVYDVPIDGYAEQYAVAVKLGETYYCFTRALENITTLQELPILESTISSASFSFLDEGTERTYADISVSTLQPLFTFLKNNANSLNLYTGLTIEAAEQNTQIADTLSWESAISLDSAQFGFAGTLYFDVSAGIWKADMMDSICYFISTPDTLSTMLTDIHQNCESEGKTAEAYPAFNPNASEPNETTLDIAQNDLLYQLQTQNTVSFQAVSGVMHQKYADDTEDYSSTVSFQMDLIHATKNIQRVMDHPIAYSIPSEPTDGTLYVLPREKLSLQEIWTENKWYTIYPDLQAYRVSDADTSDWSTLDKIVNLFMDGNSIFSSGIFYMPKEFSINVLNHANIFLLGSVSYLERDCYIVAVCNNEGTTTRYLIDKENQVSLKTETSGIGFEKINYFSNISFDEQAEPVPAVDEESLLNGLSPLPDYIS